MKLEPFKSRNRGIARFICIPSALLALALLLGAPALAQLAPPGVQYFDSDDPGLNTLVPEEGDEFGYAVASGDFNCDGNDELAIAMPGDTEGGSGAQEAGWLIVIPSTSSGLTVASSEQTWSQADLEGVLEDFDRFGEVLVSGDFDDNGCDDLVVGVPLENVSWNGTNETNAGAINVIYGTPDGLTAVGNQLIHQGDLTYSAPEAGDEFGAALAVGDFNSDGVDDLAVGAPGQDITAGATTVNAGAVWVLFGQDNVGLSEDGDVALRRSDGVSLDGNPQANEELGAALVGASLNSLSFKSALIIGAPGRNVGGNDAAGALLRVTGIGGATLFNTVWSQATGGIPGAAETGDRFGASLAAGDFDGDGVEEVAVGVPEEDQNSGGLVAAIGAVNTFDWNDTIYELWTQDDIPPEAEDTGERFGAVLTVGDFDNDGVDDLVASAPREDLGAINDAGLVHVLYGEYGIGLTDDRDQIFIQMISPSDDDEQFGFALAAGNFDGTGGMDLSFGIPFEEVDGHADAGAVNVVYSQTLFKGGFEVGSAERWSSSMP